MNPKRNPGRNKTAQVSAGSAPAIQAAQRGFDARDLFALVWWPADRVVECLNSSGRAGSGADPERLRASGVTAMPMRGAIQSVPVPGCVDGWVALHARFGRLPLSQVLAPARSLAADGFPASPTLATTRPCLILLAVPSFNASQVIAPMVPGMKMKRYE